MEMERSFLLQRLNRGIKLLLDIGKVNDCLYLNWADAPKACDVSAQTECPGKIYARLSQGRLIWKEGTMIEKMSP